MHLTHVVPRPPPSTASRHVSLTRVNGGGGGGGGESIARARSFCKKTLFCGQANDNSTRQTEFPPSFANSPRYVPRFGHIVDVVGGRKAKTRSFVDPGTVNLSLRFLRNGRADGGSSGREGMDGIRFSSSRTRLFFVILFVTPPLEKIQDIAALSLSLNRACSRVSLALNAKLGHRADDCSFGGSVFGS